MCSCAFDDIPLIEIGPSGVFKYMMVRVHDKDKRGNKESITIIRGDERHKYHSDIYDEIIDQLKPLFCEPLGGGRLVHKPHKKTIELYGASTGFGRIDHMEAARLLRKSYPEYDITITEEEKEEDDEESFKDVHESVDDSVKAHVSKCVYPTRLGLC